jgi:ABC-type uncharacterized transport system YnjBCD ATPase subunit
MIVAMLQTQSTLKDKGEVLFDGYKQFWKNHKAAFPRDFMLYRMFLSTPATSISIESLFSAMSHVFTDKRRSISDERLGEIALANTWHRTPPEIKGGRKVIIWHVKGARMEHDKELTQELAQELADALMHEEEANAIDKDITESEDEILCSGFDALDSD